MNKDIFGTALIDYLENRYTEDMYTESTISEEDIFPLPYLFRSYKEMPKLEQKALQLAKGKVLDVGCGAGSHALYLQQKGLDVTGIDISKGAITVAQQRGVKKTIETDLLQYKDATFDTILLLMNGSGIFEELKKISIYLQHLRSLLNPGGQVLIDSSDIIYMFDEDEDGGKWIPTDVDYYGEVAFTLTYKKETTPPFKWLYIDYNTLQNAAIANGFTSELIAEGAHYDFLAKLTKL
ncbi:class I SAM-dependent methyltransferase [Zhouia sp. PK063]|uniref:class I SAM-dependent methyltransferase n=1 Tax=Zhouia sp. PK063 TaxID=3373602 RepID=UPI0037AF2A41